MLVSARMDAMTDAEHYEEFVAEPRRKVKEWARLFLIAAYDCPDDDVLELSHVSDRLGDYVESMRRRKEAKGPSLRGMSLAEMNALLLKHYG
jgi:hypothetical protein